MSDYARVEEAAAAIRSRCGAPPQMAVVLGSGLGDVADTLQDAVSFEYAAVPQWPSPGVAGHPGRLVIGTLAGRRVAALAGRTHLYEGLPPASTVFGTRVLRALGVGQIVLTNAAGGINTGFARGTLMVIDDHINLTGTSPLIGPNDERFGPRFPDMTEVYARRLRAVALEASRVTNVPVSRGVYVAVHGPSYETPAEVRFLRLIGADAVGMSIVPEAIAARHLGMEVLGLSCITNMAAGVLPQPLGHDEVLETTRRVRGAFAALLEGIIARFPARRYR